MEKQFQTRGPSKNHLSDPQKFLSLQIFQNLRKMLFSFVVFGKSEEAEISDGHLSDFLGVLGSEISFPAYTSLVFKKCKILWKPITFLLSNCFSTLKSIFSIFSWFLAFFSQFFENMMEKCASCKYMRVPFVPYEFIHAVSFQKNKSTPN